MKEKSIDKVQQFIKVNRVQELALNYNECLDLIQILASCVDEMSVKRNIAVLHYLPLLEYVPSALLKNVSVSRLGTLVHVECCPLTWQTPSVDPMQELKRIETWIKLMQ